jgi:hypothetical protein
MVKLGFGIASVGGSSFIKDAIISQPSGIGIGFNVGGEVFLKEEETMETARGIVIVEDLPVMRRAPEAWFAGTGRWRVLGTASNLKDARSLLPPGIKNCSGPPRRASALALF